jgi:hypothetical protein
MPGPDDVVDRWTPEERVMLAQVLARRLYTALQPDATKSRHYLHQNPLLLAQNLAAVIGVRCSLRAAEPPPLGDLDAILAGEYALRLEIALEEGGDKAQDLERYTRAICRLLQLTAEPGTHPWYPAVVECLT